MKTKRKYKHSSQATKDKRTGVSIIEATLGLRGHSQHARATKLWQSMSTKQRQAAIDYYNNPDNLIQ